LSITLTDNYVLDEGQVEGEFGRQNDSGVDEEELPEPFTRPVFFK
jgi:hypothetical protein